MPTDGISSWTAVTSSGSGVREGVGVGATLSVGDSDAVGSVVGVAATSVGDGERVAIGGRLAVASPSRSSVPIMMSATPATPRMIGSAHEERRFT